MEATKLIRFYTITSELGNMIYTGSTEQTLHKRWKMHTGNYNSTMSKLLFAKYGSDNCKISEIFNKVCDKTERDKIESDYIRQYKNNNEYNCVNVAIPNRTVKEYKTQYYNDNKNKIKQNYNDNKEQINKKCICDCGKGYNYSHKLRHEQSKFHINFTLNINISGTENTTNINIQELTDQIKTQLENLKK